MRILVINPNSTAAMTASIEQVARHAAGPTTGITALNPRSGPAAIEGPEDGAAALPGLFALFDENVAGAPAYDAVIVACFDDTGLWKLKRRSPVPVIGIGEAAFHAAMLVARRFSVVTTLAVSIPVIEGNLARYGFRARCAAVRASGIPVLDLESAPDASLRRIEAEIALAIAEDGCDAVVLGCAGMADFAAELSRRFGLPVIDGITAAVALAEAVERAVPALPSLGGRPDEDAAAP